MINTHKGARAMVHTQKVLEQWYTHKGARAMVHVNIVHTQNWSTYDPLKGHRLPIRSVHHVCSFNLGGKPGWWISVGY